MVKDLFYTAMLLLLITILSSSRFFEGKFYLFLGWNFLLIMLLAWYSVESTLILFTAILAVMFSYLLLYLMWSNQTNQAQLELYENVLVEYRQLKRVHMTTEGATRAEERTRIAREIHDSVGHRLTALLMKIEMLHIAQPDGQLLELKQMTNDSLQETREAVQALQTTETTGLGAIVQLIRKLEAESQLLIAFTLKEGVLSIALTNEQGIVLYRVIQEALTNVMRHSKSKQIHIEIGKAAIDGLKFTIKNPLLTHQAFTAGFGMKNMHARLQELGGKLDIYQTEDQFIVSGFLPFKRGEM
jgi:signal transduction histidine kinase